jgi:hypothetical protein
VQRSLWPSSIHAAVSGSGCRGFVALFLATFFGGSVLIFLMLLAIDPYDSGRFPSLGIAGIVDENPRTASVSRGRDARFNAAIVGNSHGQLLAPARLDRATGLRFVQLTVPGTGPREQVATLRWFVRHHGRIGAVVIAVDRAWCTQDASLPVTNPFPFWLYRESDREYLANLFSIRSLDVGFRRVMLALGLRAPSDPAGYWDYEAGHEWNFRPAIPDEAPEVAQSTAKEFSFPAVTLLTDVLNRLPGEVPVVVVMPPVFFTELPRAGSEDAARLEQCKQAVARAVAARPGSAFLDFMRDTPVTRDPANFMDPGHYRAGVAMQIEAEIARSLARARN